MKVSGSELGKAHYLSLRERSHLEELIVHSPCQKHCVFCQALLEKLSSGRRLKIPPKNGRRSVWRDLEA